MGESKFNYEVPEEFEIESIAIDNAITYRERFPFGKRYLEDIIIFIHPI